MLNKFFSVYRFILYALIVVYLILAIAPMAIGIKPYIVLSASMEPTIQTGALAYINPKETSDIHENDIVAFTEGEDSAQITIIHRINQENEDGTFITKGDNNDTVDFATLTPSQIVGKVKYNIPKLGYITSWLQSKKGIIVAIALVAIAFISSFITDVSEESVVEEGQKESEETEEQLISEIIPKVDAKIVINPSQADNTEVSDPPDSSEIQEELSTKNQVSEENTDFDK